MRTTRLFYLLGAITLLICTSCKKDGNTTEELNLSYTKQDILCSGGLNGSIELMVTGGISPYTYQWSSGESTKDLTSLKTGTYIITVLDAESNFVTDSIVIDELSNIDIQATLLPNEIDLTVTGGNPPYKFLWSTGATTEDLSNYTNQACNVVVTDAEACTDSMLFEIYYEDGIYVIGDAISSEYNPLQLKMENAINEATLDLKPELYRLYIPISADAAGFHIIIVKNGLISSIQGANDFAIVPDPGFEESAVPCWKGGYEPGSEPFTVQTDDLYLIGLDTEIEKVIILPVDHFAIIGSATPGGWSEETVMESSPISPSGISYSVSDVILIDNEFKYRHSDTWQVILDPGDSGIGRISLHCNYGGEVENLTTGGNNISNTIVGVYETTVNWTIDDGFTAQLTKTGDYVISPRF